MDLLSLLISIVTALFGMSSPIQTTRQSNPSPSPPIQKTVQYKEVPYAYGLIGPIHPKAITIHSNLPGKKTSKELLKDYSCKYLVNGGFYTKHNTHIGLFLIDDIVQQKQINNSLFNGFIAKTTSQRLSIDTALPDERLAFALQSGPILLEDKKPRTLSLIEDEPARRMLVGIDGLGNAYFFSIFQTNNPFNGPYLADLPEIIVNLIQNESIQIIHAMNLDGGNHSAFYSDTLSLSELAPIGSFFCIKDIVH
ncbi:MAG: phosphodiester glycosidase family protein [Patescibacteria group bacterium]|nr:phosphodiester glycosidase family protein [Patescibacteria group bacterium]